MSRIKIALSEKNLSVGDRLKNFTILSTRTLHNFMGSATVLEVSENFVSAILDNGDIIEFDARKGGNLSEVMKGWEKSTNTDNVQVGDRGYAIQQHTAIPFTYTVVEVEVGVRVVLKYDDEFRPLETKDNVPVPVDQKMERFVSGVPTIEEYTLFAPQNVEGTEEKLRNLVALIKDETPLPSAGKEKLSEQLFENSVFSSVVNMAWSKGELSYSGVYLNEAILKVSYDFSGGTVDIISAEFFPGYAKLPEGEIQKANNKLKAYLSR